MDEAWAREMSAATRAFYERVGESFSATRQHAWEGWELMLPHLALAEEADLRLLDVASGNLRYERFLEGRVERLEAWCADVSATMASCAQSTAHIHMRTVDVAEALLQGRLTAELDAPPVDQAVCFGFMHHLPLRLQRLRLIETLVDATRPGGRVVCTFWRFERSERIMRGARKAPGGGPHDYLLGWQGSRDVERFCHHTTEVEVEELVCAVADRTRLVARFAADGRDHDLNRYVVLERL